MTLSGLAFASARTRCWSDGRVDIAQIVIGNIRMDSGSTGESVGWQWTSTIWRRISAAGN